MVTFENYWCTMWNISKQYPLNTIYWIASVTKFAQALKPQFDYNYKNNGREIVLRLLRWIVRDHKSSHSKVCGVDIILKERETLKVYLRIITRAYLGKYDFDSR